MIPAAITHINTAMTTIDWMPPATGRSRSLTTSSLVRAAARRARSCPRPGSPSRAVALEHDLLGVLEWQEHGRGPKKYRPSEVFPTTRNDVPPTTRRSPTAAEIPGLTTASPEAFAAPPLADGRVAEAASSWPMRLASFAGGPDTTARLRTTASACFTPGVPQDVVLERRVEDARGGERARGAAATSHWSAPNSATIAGDSSSTERRMPSIAQRDPEHEHVTRIAITKRRARNCRSRRLTSHIRDAPAYPISPNASNETRRRPTQTVARQGVTAATRSNPVNRRSTSGTTNASPPGSAPTGTRGCGRSSTPCR